NTGFDEVLNRLRFKKRICVRRSWHLSTISMPRWRSLSDGHMQDGLWPHKPKSHSCQPVLAVIVP
ncbi:hypothetical protein ACQZV8_19615, partial [Magnetococcales bacterium HHB-1]